MQCTETQPAAGAMMRYRAHLKALWSRSRQPGTPLKSRAFFEKAFIRYPDRSRWDPVIAKLRCGKPIVVVVIGGSITNGGGLDPQNHRRLRWSMLLLQYLNMSFPHRDHQFHSFGVQGAGSGFFSMCVPSYVPRNPDIVLTEFALNDREVAKIVKHNYETLVQQLVSIRAGLIVRYFMSDDVRCGKALLTLLGFNRCPPAELMAYT